MEGEDDDCDSVDWEDGDATVSELHEKEENAKLHHQKHEDYDLSPHENPSNATFFSEPTVQPSLLDHANHDTAVTQTLAVMEKSGALHEGSLAVQLGSSAHNLLQSHPNNEVVREKLKKLVQHYLHANYRVYSSGYMLSVMQTGWKGNWWRIRRVELVALPVPYRSWCCLKRNERCVDRC